jgi:putative oxidoreductase
MARMVITLFQEGGIMFASVQKYVPLAGRILLSAIFISSGISKIFNWEGTAGYMQAQGMPLSPLFLLGAIGVEIVGGLSVLVGFFARLGALALFLFLIPTTLIFHAFWAVPEAHQQIQMIMFMKNLAIMGGLLMVVAFGAGPVSFDQRKG